MTLDAESFRRSYARALEQHLADRTESSLAVGHDLGRRALVEGISILDVTEQHFRIVARHEPGAGEAALQFLLQTLTTLDIATRGFLDGTRRYAQQRRRADELAERNAFRRALIGSLQDGFFVADADGTVTEVNSAFGDMTGYGPEGLPYQWPHPWVAEVRSQAAELPGYLRESGGRFAIPADHKEGRSVWLAVSTNSVIEPETHRRVFVGTIRDITAERVAAAREQAATRLASAVGAATSVAEVLDAGLPEFHAAVGAAHAIAAVWTGRDNDPAVYGTDLTWAALDEHSRAMLDTARRQPALTVAQDSDESWVTAPLGGGDAALWLDYPAVHPPTAADRSLVSILVGHLSVALQRARNFDQARNTSLTLQRAMLGPIELPPRFAVRYEPAEPPLEIGGDWYDVIGLPGGKIGVVVGDCVGRGLSAAALMGQLRSSGRALLLRGTGPGQLLDELDAVASRIPGAMCTTVFGAILDPLVGEIRYSSAGHMPAVLAAPGSGGVLLDGGRAVPLATFDCTPRPEATAALAPGGTLVVYTDGLVERRGLAIDIGIETVARLLADASSHTPDDVADTVLSQLRPDVGYDDDVAMVVYRQPPRPLDLDVPADATELAGIRHHLQEWLDAAAVPTDVATDLVLATNEACTNSIEHGYRDRTPGRITVTATTGPSELTVTVADTGAWRPVGADRGNRGRGLAMMEALSDAVDIDRTTAGTVVRMSTTLTTKPFAVHRRGVAG